MNIFSDLFNTILYQPLLNILVLLYEYFPGHDFGIAIIILTILIRLAFYPLSLKAVVSQKQLQKLQPRIKEIQEKYKNNKEEMTRAVMELYKKEKINLFSGCLPVLIQLPILFTLYQVFWKGFLPEQMALLYSFVPHPGKINPHFLNFINLSEPNFYMALLAGFSQFLQAKTADSFHAINKTSKSSQIEAMLQKQMIYLFPFLTILILSNLPSAISLYWLVSSLFTVLQQYLIFTKN